jgi:hypothetical protein
MDITAPFFTDMGLVIGSTEIFRSAVRTEIERDPGVIDRAGATEAQKREWLSSFDTRLRVSLGQVMTERFWAWVSNTYTFSPADRPNWELYDMFFFTWSTGMRDGVDIAGCFTNPILVYQAYNAFVPGRRLKERIADGRQRVLSRWDEKVFDICGYSLSEEDVDWETIFEPFGTVDATASRNYFQEFWEYALPIFSEKECINLYQAVRKSDINERLPDLVVPGELNRSVR